MRCTRPLSSSEVELDTTRAFFYLLSALFVEFLTSLRARHANRAVPLSCSGTRMASFESDFVEKVAKHLRANMPVKTRKFEGKDMDYFSGTNTQGRQCHVRSPAVCC